jgi:hypothetical protein
MGWYVEADIRISFHVLSSSSYVAAIKPRAKEKFCTAAFFYCTLDKNITNRHYVKKYYFRRSAITFYLVH